VRRQATTAGVTPCDDRLDRVDGLALVRPVDDGRLDAVVVVPVLVGLAAEGSSVTDGAVVADGDGLGDPHPASTTAATSSPAPAGAAARRPCPCHTRSTVAPATRVTVAPATRVAVAPATRVAVAPAATSLVDDGPVPRLRHLAALTAIAALVAGCAGAGQPSAAGPSAPVPGGATVPSTLSATSSGTPTVSVTPAPTRTTAGPRPTATRTTSTRPTSRPAPRPGLPYVTHVRVPAGCLVVSPAIVGIKVYLVQKALHLVGHRERYDAATVAAVKAFQSAHALPVTGKVDATTWAALGTGYDFCVDRYTQQPAVSASASAKQRIEAMIAYASGRVGLPYVWGGAGPMGFDCSGLALQALYAGGVAIPGVSTDLHVQADFRTTQALYASRLLHVPFSQRRRGDLVLYGSPISHLAIYLGGNRILEAVRPAVRTASGVFADGLPAQPSVLRPFPY
jgi:cell wall-associated NlpC family hydrolase